MQNQFAKYHKIIIVKYNIKPEVSLIKLSYTSGFILSYIFYFLSLYRFDNCNHILFLLMIINITNGNTKASCEEFNIN